MVVVEKLNLLILQVKDPLYYGILIKRSNPQNVVE